MHPGGERDSGVGSERHAWRALETYTSSHLQQPGDWPPSHTGLEPPGKTGSKAERRDVARV